jgi:hypothetical protein
MINRIFPLQFDNNFRGSKIALFVFAPIIIFKGIMGFNIGGLNPWISASHILEEIDQIPLSTMPSQLANNILFSSMAWGILLLLLCILGMIALFRYRTMIPMLFLFLLTEQIGRRWINFQLYQAPLIDLHDLSAAAIINWSLTILLMVGFALSLSRSKKS